MMEAYFVIFATLHKTFDREIQYTQTTELKHFVIKAYETQREIETLTVA